MFHYFNSLEAVGRRVRQACNVQTAGVSRPASVDVQRSRCDVPNFRQSHLRIAMVFRAAPSCPHFVRLISFGPAGIFVGTTGRPSPTVVRTN